ncbi:GNAT family N-acetyltransferase [Brevibacterium luteolum]|uniref:GNAT family N-acetyltransferase n=1 Tax=Brevibacterium luteolum TaxID=199591 RepID=UPI00223BA93D|nr:GNAT family N-acetyltransferase [Brevibacterium luteolum]MCT1829751.1 GNAT family N-acetyltransferase [Brevibacterium luteolum]
MTTPAGEAFAPVQVGEADIPDWVVLIESAYRGDASRAGWTTEADLLDGQRLDAQLAAQTLAEPGTVVFLVRAADSTPLATVQLVERDDACAYLGMFAVAPAAQGTGTGSKLMAWAEAWVEENWHAARIRMSVIRQRSELIAYYQRRGYAPTGEVEPFPYGDERFGIPKRDDLEFAILEKQLG